MGSQEQGSDVAGRRQAHMIYLDTDVARLSRVPKPIVHHPKIYGPSIHATMIEYLLDACSLFFCTQTTIFNSLLPFALGFGAFSFSWM